MWRRKCKVYLFCTSRFSTASTDLRTDPNGVASTRPLGLLVARGTLLVSISPLDGSAEIANPFLNADEEDDA